ncbi:MAG: hypothetical protein ACM3NQ_02410 [Bacteroidales bacterium]
MELFLMVATVSLLGVVVTLGLFAAATGGDGTAAENRASVAAATSPRLGAPIGATAGGPPMFFVKRAGDRSSERVPIEVLLLQIERHVRLEQAAAESFLDAPTVHALHTRTTSPLLN